jgi:UDP-2,3-diacylglucosamine pyrophosphatase LpxH
MIVCISDLHFRDEKKYTVNDHSTDGFLVKSLIPMIQDAKPKKVTVLFVGDIVDINRSPYWVDGQSGGYTPWSNWRETLNAIKPGAIAVNGDFKSVEFEKHILAVLERIRSANTANYELLHQFKDTEGPLWKGEEHKPEEIRFEFIPGNHDRLTQYSQATRAALIRHLFLDDISETPFPWVKYDEEHRVFAFHGHVLTDMDFGGRSEQPDDYAVSPWYMLPSLGDVATITFGVRLYHDYNGDPNVQRMLAEIDLLRPQSAVLRWLLSRVEARPDIRKDLDNLVARLAQGFIDDPFVCWRLSSMEKLKIGIMKLLGKHKTIEGVMSLVNTLAGGDQSREEYTKEMVGKITSPKFTNWYNSRYPEAPNIVTGHTHFPLITPLLGDREGNPSAPMHYFNSGTWLDTLERGQLRGYSRRRQITHVTFYKEGEDAKPDGTRSYWEYWDGCLKSA